jgi:integrase
MPKNVKGCQEMPSDTCVRTDTVRTRGESRKLTDRSIGSLDRPQKGPRILYDSRLPGFGIRLTSGGSNAFILNYRFEGRERRITIGSFPAWTVLAALQQARKVRRDIDLGSDPLEEREQRRTAPTVRDLFERYASEHLPNKAPRSAADDRSMWTKEILPHLGSRKVTDVRPSDCDELHRMIAETRPVRANRIMEVFRKALNLAIRWEWIERNPASGCRRSVEQKRHRYLSRDEIGQLLIALNSHPCRTSADALLFMLLTGCRRGEALSARWEQFDIQKRVWTKPSSETKQRREHRVPYSASVAEILGRRRVKTDGAYIFPGRLGAPLGEVRKTWTTVCRQAQLDGVRVHDLRHTFASLVASSGQSLLVVGELLGHSTAQTTKRYAHLYDETLRSAAESVSESLNV